jgi:hypothetical protein
LAVDNALSDADVLGECDGLDAEPLVTDPNQIDTDEHIEALQAFMLSSASLDSDVGIVQAYL